MTKNMVLHQLKWDVLIRFGKSPIIARNADRSDTSCKLLATSCKIILCDCSNIARTLMGVTQQAMRKATDDDYKKLYSVFLF